MSETTPVVTVAARCRRADVALSPRGQAPYLDAWFELEDGQERPMTDYVIDMDFVRRFLAVWRAESLREVAGKSCRLTMEESRSGHRWGSILRIEPLIPGDGKPFDIPAWRADIEHRETILREHGMRLLTGT